MKKIVLFMLSALLALGLAGCASETTPQASPSPMMTTAAPATQAPTEAPTVAPTIAPEQTASSMMSTGAPSSPSAAGMASEMTDEDAMTVAEAVSTEVARLSEIDKATTVVVGDTALIGVSFDTQYQGEMTTRIKDMVADRAKTADARIQNVWVTADPDLLERVQALWDKRDGGSAVADITDEFQEIVNRLMPQG